MKLREIISAIEEFAPPSLQEPYDNAGLIIGNPEQEIKSALLCLDVTEAVIDEAVVNSDLVVSHHPVIFSSLKRLTGSTYTERAVIRAIQNNVCIYAAHTNLDKIKNGVNQKIAEKLSLQQTQVLRPQQGFLRKLYTFVPKQQAEHVREALFAAGAGMIGNYDECSFNAEGMGTFRAGENTTPFVGKQNVQHHEDEVKIEVVFPSWRERPVIQALLESHPYEEVAYDIISLQNTWNEIGDGLIGSLEQPVKIPDFLKFVCEKFNVECIRHSKLVHDMIRKVAVCGGSGSFLLKDAIQKNADVFITADFKYHQFFDAEDRIIILDIGHYESEQFTQEILYQVLRQKYPNFAVRFSTINTNPVNYFKG